MPGGFKDTRGGGHARGRDPELSAVLAASQVCGGGVDPPRFTPFFPHKEAVPHSCLEVMGSIGVPPSSLHPHPSPPSPPARLEPD